MAAGLQVFTAEGLLRLDITDRLTRLIGTFTFPPWYDASTRFISVPGMTDDGHWAVVYDAESYYHTIGNGGVTIRSGYPYSTPNLSIPIVPFSIYRT